MNAGEIKRLLDEKHCADIGGAEIKTGPTASYGKEGPKRLDYWAMKPSWTNPQYTGYEIKVSRADFLQDNKWPAYLPYCQYFYFVCPQKLISVEEVPQDAGLMWVTENGMRLYTKKKAPFRQIMPPPSIFIYLLMWRAEKKEYSKLESWKQWLEQKQEKQDIGHAASRRLWRLYQDRVTNVERKQGYLESQLEEYSELRAFLDENKLRITDWNIKKKTKSLLETGLPDKLRDALEATKKQIDDLLNAKD